MTLAARNPFSSGWVRGGADERLRPQGTLSYVSGATDDPLRFRTISQALDKCVAAHGSKDAAIFAADGVTLSWYDLQRRADEVAAALLALGIRRGNRVGIWAPNRVEWLLVQFGTARIGAILVNINPAYRSSELEYALNKVRCRALIMARSNNSAPRARQAEPAPQGGQGNLGTARRSLASSDYIGILKDLAPELDRPGTEPVLESRRLPHLKHVIVLGDAPVPARAQKFSDFIRHAGPAHKLRLPGLAAELDPDDAINIQFTSGTTGAPKGATLSHFNVVNNARYCADAMAFTAKDRLCIPVPLYHCFGMVLGVLVCVASGATMVFPGESFDAAQTISTIARHRCTALHGVPTMFIAMLAHPSLAQHDVSTLRTGIMAGAPCPIETMRQVVSRLHMSQVTIAYGMTETSPISFQSSVDDPLERRVSTVGRIHPHAEVKIVDGDGRIVPVGQSGELCTRGYCVMRGYWEDEERTQESIDASGWMHTGDLATIDAEGYCNIVGRVKDMLIRGGENVYPREIEEFLHRHAAVQEAQVFGIPDPRYGEEICAWIVLKAGHSASAEEIATFCQGQIAHYKVPRQIRFVTEFPLTATGKPQKFVMREVMMRELGLEEAKTA